VSWGYFDCFMFECFVARFVPRLFGIVVCTCQMKKALRETQTLHAGCSKAEPKTFRPAGDPLPGGAGRPKLVMIDARNFELSW